MLRKMILVTLGLSKSSKAGDDPYPSILEPAAGVVWRGELTMSKNILYRPVG